ncbi:MAG: ABC transporter substrate-binding protein, partial [Pseudomonadota bacterium]
MVKKILILMLLAVFLISGHALAQSKPGGKAETKASVASAPKPGGMLIFGRGGDSVGLDPAYETDGNSFMICDSVFEALVEYKDESTDVEPLLAESWSISPDSLTYTFKLRKGV